jgi:RNA polymerase sigma factor for flagellar operon FliA
MRSNQVDHRALLTPTTPAILTNIGKKDIISTHKPATPKQPLNQLTADLEREQTLLRHMPAIQYMARRIHERLPQHVELEDMVSAGVIGLIDAYNKFDDTKHVQFYSYAQFRIRGAILDSLRVGDWSPRELRRKGRAVQEAIQAITRSQRRTPTEPEIATELHLTLNEYQLLVGQLKGLEIGSLSLEHHANSGEDKLAFIAGSPRDEPLFQCLMGETRQILIDAIDELPVKERKVLTLYYYEELNMKDIGLILGVVESRISQIHAGALVRLRLTLKGLRKEYESPTSTKRIPRKVADC